MIWRAGPIATTLLFRNARWKFINVQVFDEDRIAEKLSCFLLL